MKITLTASTGAKIHVWRKEDMFCSRLTDSVAEPEMCLPIDLFEVIAELAGLDLEAQSQSDEAMALADHAFKVLGVHDVELVQDDDAEEPPAIAR